MSWKMYKGVQGSGRYSVQPTVSIAKNGYLVISKVLSSLISTTYQHAELYYDDVSFLVGIKFVSGKPEAYHHKIQRSKTNGMKIRADGFLHHFKIFPSETICCPANYEEASRQIVVDMDKGKAVRRIYKAKPDSQKS